MKPTNSNGILDVIQNHRALLDEFESYLKKGETEKLTIAVRGLLVSATFLDELVTHPAQPIDPGPPATSKIMPPQV